MEYKFRLGSLSPVSQGKCILQSAHKWNGMPWVYAWNDIVLNSLQIFACKTMMAHYPMSETQMRKLFFSKSSTKTYGISLSGNPAVMFRFHKVKVYL